MTGPGKRFVGGVGRLALNLAAVAGTLAVLLAVLTVVLDLRLLTFRSGSMSPAIDTGALAVARPVPAGELRVGDVVSVRTDTGSRVTHRIVAVDHEGARARLVLRGDGNRVADAQPYQVAKADRVWFAVPLLGYAAAALASPIGLFLLGLYAAFLCVLLLRRPVHPAGRRRVSASALAVVVGVGAAGAVAGSSSPTSAAWVDSVGTTGSTFTAAVIPAPAPFTCGAIGFFSVSFTWTAVPGATSYTLHYGTGGASTATVSGTSATLTAAVTGGTAWVTTERNFGSTTWTSVPSTSRTYSVLAISVCG